MDSNLKEESIQDYTVIAVCGCGHDGRLGFGNETSISEISMIPFFSPQYTEKNTLDQSGNPSEQNQAKITKLRSVRCGHYHTFAICGDCVYGWGINEEGQLGLGHKTSCFFKPVPIPFFSDKPLASSNQSSAGETLIDIHCGGNHSIAITNKGVYGCGSNKFGQLGMGTRESNSGDDDYVFEWTLIFSLPVQFFPNEVSISGWHSVDSDLHNATKADSVVKPMPFSGDNFQLLRGELQSASCGSHHTLMAFCNALILDKKKSDSTEDSTSSPDESAPRNLLFYPSIILAAGKGDYGELGYDVDDPWAIIHAKDKRARDALKSKSAFGIDNSLNPDQDAENDSFMLKKKMVWKKNKKRRAEFFSSVFKPVQFPLLDNFASVLPIESFEWNQYMDICQQAKDSASCSVENITAMELHSSARIRLLLSEKASTLTYHWGCYYCNEVEDDASSVPRLVNGSTSDRPNVGDFSVNDILSGNALIRETPSFDIHAGKEVLFRYACDSLKPVEVIGSGISGLGEDSFYPEWTAIPNLLHDEENEKASLTVRSVSGRDHFLFGLSREKYLDNLKSRFNQPVIDAVMGFGECLHGQLGNSVRAKSSDTCFTPVRVLGVGDILASPHQKTAPNDEVSKKWKVVDILQACCGARHSVFLLRVTPFDASVN